MTRKVLLSAAACVLAAAVACNKSTPNPTSPTSATQPETGAAPDGSTLKVSAPSAVSPVNNAKPDQIVLVINPASGRNQQLTLSYEFEILSGTTSIHRSGTIAGTGGQISYTPAGVDFNADQQYTWRARAVFQGAVGPWSANATFLGPDTGFLRGNEVRDPLTNGKTVGLIVGPTQFIPGEGLKLLTNTSYLKYPLQATLTAGQFSMMIKGADEGTPGDKSKVFAMQQGDDVDITTNNYRFTAELRGANYSAPGSISCRMIAGDGVSRDCARVQRNFDSSRWYFWKLTWNVGGSFTMEVREDNENGRVIYSYTHGLSGRTYRPTPHMAYLGSPVGRAGPIDATLPNGIYKNVYIGPNARPTFPQ
ncbi:MAG TPA: hypothetical protein VFK57_09070 [Vicinamibacterales bacterium]|nr:hypothetical protein [Vicinamibacterales bacterium]